MEEMSSQKAEYQEKVKNYTAKLADYGSEIRDGIFNMVISLVEFRAKGQPSKDNAKEEVASWLEELAQALRSTINTNQEDGND